MNPALNRFNPLRILIEFNIISHLCLDLQSDLFLVRFPINILYECLHCVGV
jgi:hypothetical protein